MPCRNTSDEAFFEKIKNIGKASIKTSFYTIIFLYFVDIDGRIKYNYPIEINALTEKSSILHGAFRERVLGWKTFNNGILRSSSRACGAKTKVALCVCLR